MKYVSNSALMANATDLKTNPLFILASPAETGALAGFLQRETFDNPTT